LKVIYGYPGDILGGVWRYWWNERSGEPFFQLNPLFDNLMQVLTHLFGGIAATQLVQISGFAIAFLTAYYLASQLTRCRRAGVLAGLAYGFSLYNLWHGMQNIELLLGVSLLPLYVWALLNLVQPWNVPNGPRVPTGVPIRKTVVAAIAYALVSLSSANIGYLAFLFTAGFLLIQFLRVRSASLFFAHRSLLSAHCSLLIAHCFLFSAFCFILTLPATYPLIRYYLNPQDPSYQTQNIRQTLETRQSDEAIAYGARPWDYLMPSIYHPLFGRYVENFYNYLKENATYQFWSPFLPERVNYIPITIWFLAAFAVYRILTEARKRRLDRNSKFQIPDSISANVTTFALLALLMFAVSMPAKITVRSLPIYFPSFFLFKVFPMFRVYARAGVFVLLCVLVITSCGLCQLLEKATNPKTKRLLFIVLCSLIFFENLNFPPFHLLDLSQIPAVYYWLKEQTNITKITEYPRDMEPGGGCTPNVPLSVRKDFCPTCALYFQTVHQKALFTGDSLSPEDRRAIADLSSDAAHRILTENGVDLVIVHTKDPFPQPNPLDTCQERRIMEKPEKVNGGFKLIEEFDGTIVYQVQPQPQSSILPNTTFSTPGVENAAATAKNRIF